MHEHQNGFDALQRMAADDRIEYRDEWHCIHCLARIDPGEPHNCPNSPPLLAGGQGREPVEPSLAGLWIVLGCAVGIGLGIWAAPHFWAWVHSLAN